MKNDGPLTGSRRCGIPNTDTSANCPAEENARKERANSDRKQTRLYWQDLGPGNGSHARKQEDTAEAEQR